MEVTVSMTATDTMPQVIVGARAAIVVTVIEGGAESCKVAFACATDGPDACRMVAHLISHIKNEYGMDVAESVVERGLNVIGAPLIQRDLPKL